MSSQQIDYLNDGSINVYDNETYYSANFTIKGNTITVFENEEPLPVEVLTINNDGYITKREKSGEGDGAWNSITTYEYKDGNPIKITTTVTTRPANTTSVTTETLTFDNKKSPFWYSKTPYWFMQFHEYNNTVGIKNNVLEHSNTADNSSQKFTYDYNSDGMLDKQTSTTWNNDVEVATYTYSKSNE